VRFDVVTLFPEFFSDPLGAGLVGKAIESQIASVSFIDPREFTTDKHRTVDDTPYGGGGGMVMKPEPVIAAIDRARSRGSGPVILMSPQGARMEQSDLFRWSKHEQLILVSGRYEGFDERIRARADEEASLGDFVLTGGEYAALAVIDGVIRLLPGTLGNEASPLEDSFAHGLLEHPQYTRPAELGVEKVPDVLLSGHHAEIRAWRTAQSLARTKARRPDLLEERALDQKERRALAEAPSTGPKVEVAVGFAPSAEVGEAYGVLSSCTRIAAAYGASIRFVAPPANLVLALEKVERVWAESGKRAEPISVLRDWAELFAQLSDPKPIVVTSFAGPELTMFAALERASAEGPRALVRRAKREGKGLLLVLGDGLVGRAPIDVFLPSIRASSAVNGLPLPAALAVLLDRIIGEA
jgi:tRNA (guanine-N1)-methyltransferase